MIRARAVVLAAILAAVFTVGAVAGCGSRRTLAENLDVTNEPGFFEFRVGRLDRFTMTNIYEWTNPDTAATVRQSSIIEEGVALLEIRDPTGLVVHSKNLREVGTMLTFAGQPGTWKITVTLDEATGSAQFQVRDVP